MSDDDKPVVLAATVGSGQSAADIITAKLTAFSVGSFAQRPLTPPEIKAIASELLRVVEANPGGSGT